MTEYERALMSLDEAGLNQLFEKAMAAKPAAFSGARQPERSTMSIASPYDTRAAEIARTTLPKIANDVAMLGANFAPGSGEYLSAQQSAEDTAKAREAFAKGNYGEAATSGANALVNAVGSLPIAHQAIAAGKGAIGLAKGLLGAEHIIPAITTFHGSPKKGIKKLSNEFVGSGEGAQAYGWGSYTAEGKGTGEWYRDKLSGIEVSYKGEPNRINNPQLSETILQDLGIDSDSRGVYGQAVNIALRDKSQGKNKNTYTNETQRDIYDYVQKNVNIEKAGSTYQVELLPHQDEYLQWDKPLNQQSEKVRAAIGQIDQSKLQAYSRTRKKLEAYFEGSANKYGDVAKGSDLYSALSDYGTGDQKAASAYLESLGIKGIKYLDGTSRGKGEGNYNYVTFNPEAESIITHENDVRIPNAVEEAYAKVRDPESKALLEQKYPELRTTPVSVQQMYNKNNAY